MSKNDEQALLEAAKNGSLEEVETYLSSNVNVNCKDEHDCTPLYRASINGHFEIVKVLLKHNADPNITSYPFGNSPLYQASWEGYTDIVEVLLKYKADPDNNRYTTPLQVARNGLVAECLINNGAKINQRDTNGRTPLYNASMYGRTDVVEVLMKYNANPNIADYQDRHTALHVADNEAIAECLVQGGANVDPLSKGLWTPLYLASSRGHTETVKVLLKNRANPNKADESGRTPLHVADNEIIVECLIDSRADVNKLDNLNKNPLHLACYNGKETVKVLLQNGANIKARDKDGFTPIDYLKQSYYTDEVSNGRKKCLEWLDQMGYLEDANTDPIADLTSEISSSSPSIDKTSYGLSLDIDPSSLSNDSPVLADIKVFAVDDDKDSLSFVFPEDTRPVSAVYSITLQSDTDIIPRTLRIRHCADPNDPEQLEHLTFVKSSNDASSKLEAVPGGIFRPGEQYGEITPPHMCSWSIVGNIKKVLFEKTLYKGMILYRTVKHSSDRWLMELFVGKNNPSTIIALNEYISNKCGSIEDSNMEEFVFMFQESVDPKLSLTTGKEKRSMKCSNGWEISLVLYEISQDVVDRFRKPTDVPGRCRVKIHTHMNVCHELTELPILGMKGIVSDKKDIQIDIPDDDDAELKSQDYTNVKPQIEKGESLTLEAVFELMKRYSAKWNEFARALKISYNDRQIWYDERISAEMRLERVINHWIESECSPVTWDCLVEVFKKMGLQDLVDIIEVPQTESTPDPPQIESIPRQPDDNVIKLNPQLPLQIEEHHTNNAGILSHWRRYCLCCGSSGYETN